jgi:hypothetical protein
MKIEGNRPNVDASTVAGVDNTRVGQTSKGKGPLAGGDAVTVSPDAALAAKAIQAASRALEVRPDAVARGKALLAGGQLGRDADGLANALIQRLLDDPQV